MAEISSFSKLIEGNEGRRAFSYTDSVGKATVGVGYNLDQPGAREEIEDLGINYSFLRRGDIDLEPRHQDTLRDRYIGRALNTVAESLPTFDSLSGGRQAAVVDMAYQLGPGGFKSFNRMITAISIGDFEEAARQIEDSKYWREDAPARARRSAEAMRTGIMVGFVRDEEPLPLEPAVDAALRGNPEEVAKARDTARRLGIDTSFVLSAPQVASNESLKLTLDELFQNAPVTQEWAQQIGNLDIGVDDIANLTEFESTADGLTALGAAGRGMNILFGLVSRFAEATGELTGSERLEAFGQKQAEKFNAKVETIGGGVSIFDVFDGKTSFGEWLKTGGIETAVLGLPVIGLGIGGAIVGAPVLLTAAAAGFVGMVLGVGSVQENIKEIDKDVEAPGTAFGFGAAVGALDAIPGLRLGSIIRRAFGEKVAEKVAKSVAMRIAVEAGKSAGIEAITEGVQETLETIGAAVGTKTKVDMRNLSHAIVEGMFRGFFFGFGTGGGTQTAVEIKSAIQKKGVLDKLNETHKKSKVRQREPVAAANHAASVLRGVGAETVTVEALALMKAAQARADETNTNAIDVLTKLGVLDQMEEDLLNDTPIEITAQAFSEIFLGTEAYTTLANDTAIGQGTTVNQAVKPVLSAVARVEKKAREEPSKLAAEALATIEEMAARPAQAGEVFTAASEEVQTFITEGLGRRKPKAPKRPPRKVSDIAKVLKAITRKVKPKIQAGRPVGKFEPESQEVLSEINRIARLTQKEARAELEKNEGLTVDEQKGELLTEIGRLTGFTSKDAQAELKKRQVLPIDEQDELTNRVLGIVAGGGRVTPEAAESTLREVELIRTLGLDAGRARADARAARANKDVKTFLEPLLTQRDKFPINPNAWQNKLRTLQKVAEWANTGLTSGWQELLNLVADIKGFNGQPLINKLMITDQIQEAKRLIWESEQELDARGMKAYGLSDVTQLKAKRQENNQTEVVNSSFVNANGTTVHLNYTISELQQFWAEMQDPALEERYLANDGNAYTKEMVDTLLEKLSSKDELYAQAMVDQLKAMHPIINETYTKLTGVNLPLLPGYIPVRTETGQTPGQEFADMIGTVDIAGIGELDLFSTDIEFRTGVPGATKKRTAIGAIQKRNIESSVGGWIFEMSHFAKTAERANHIRNVVRNKAFRQAMTEAWGEKLLREFDSFVQEFSIGHTRGARGVESYIANVNKMFTKSVLFFNPLTGLKQLASTTAMYEGKPAGFLTKKAVQFYKNRKVNAQWMWDNSVSLRTRGASVDVDLANLSESKRLLKPVAPGVNRWIDRWGAVFIRLGDREAFVALGYARVKHDIEVLGLSQEQAFRNFDRMVNSTQQSADADRLSTLQRGGPWGRAMSMFMTAKNSLFRAEMRAWRGLLRGKISKGEFTKLMAIHHFAIPTMIQFLANGFKWDNDRQLLAMGLGSMVNYMIFGQLMWQIGTNMFTDDGGPFYKPEIPLLSIVWDLGSGIVNLGGDIEDDTYEGFWDIAENLGHFFGKPIGKIHDVWDGIWAAADGEVGDATKIILGVSPTELKKSDKKKGPTF